MIVKSHGRPRPVSWQLMHITLCQQQDRLNVWSVTMTYAQPTRLTGIPCIWSIPPMLQVVCDASNGASNHMVVLIASQPHHIGHQAYSALVVTPFHSHCLHQLSSNWHAGCFCQSSCDQSLQDCVIAQKPMCPGSKCRRANACCPY